MPSSVGWGEASRARAALAVLDAQALSPGPSGCSWAPSPSLIQEMRLVSLIPSRETPAVL